jgi:hypothetical protein
MRAPLIIALALVTVPLTACGGGSDDKPQAAATAPADTAAATAQVKSNWAEFFGGTKPVTQRSSLLEDGASLSEALTLAEKNPLAAQTSSSVSSVTFTSATQAEVKYDLSIAGNKVTSDSDGTAVLQDGTWKVSKFTFCQLQKAGSKSGVVPGCA